MAIIVPPAPLPLRNVSWRAPFPAQVNRSGWTGRSKIVGLPGATVWTVSGSFVTIIGADRGKPWRGFFTALHGQLHKFRVRGGEDLQTTAANPTVRAGANDGVTVPLAGLPANKTVLISGSLMTVPLPSGHERMVCLTADLVSNGLGQGTATFGPELGEVPATGAVVEIGRPWSLVRQTNKAPGWDVEPGQKYIFALDAEEAL
jgi:hypothetical protein